MKISMLGWYGRNNIGDEAFKLAHRILLAGHAIEYAVDTVDPAADLVVLGGGDVVLPFYLDVIPKDREFYLLGTGLGYDYEIDYLTGRNVREAVFRNKADVELAVSKGIPAVYAPDLTFVNDLRQIPEGESLPTSERKKAAVILSDHISPSPWHNDPKKLGYFEYFKWELADSLSYLAEFYDLYWLPLSGDPDANDHRIHLDVFGRMNRRENSGLLPYPGSPEGAVGVLKQMDLVISMKYHGVLFATNLGVPFVNIGFSRKTQLFCTDAGLSEITLPPFTFEKNRFLAAVKAAEASGLPRRLKDLTGRNRTELVRLGLHLKSNWLR